MFNASNRSPRRIVGLLILLIAYGAATTGWAEEKAEPKAEKPKTDPQVQALLDKHLRTDPSYSPGDILARDQVEPIYNDILDRGLKPTTDGESAYTPILRETHYLVQLLRTPQGRALMKQIGNKPLAYDRLDRLSWLPGGKALVQQVVESPNGAELFDKVFSEEGIKAIESQLPKESQGLNFELPTGKLYTESALGAELTQTLRKQLAKKAAATPGSAKGSKTSSKSTVATKKNGGA